MFILGNMVTALARIIDIILEALKWLIIIRALISWVNPDPYNQIVQFLQKTTDPLLAPIRKYIPMTGIDFSPIIAFLVIYFAQIFLVSNLLEIGIRLR
ncbi:MAG: YggT family protein [Candidatus Omnitrophica bacterium]|nr:YggT family protein [Candidatus Omnitrophota bacterium]